MKKTQNTTPSAKFSKIAPKPVTTVYIGNLDYDRTEKDIKVLFSHYGKVKSAKIVLDSETEKSKGIAFVQMFDETEAKDAIKGLNGLRFDNRTLKVSIANDRYAEVDAKRAQAKMKELGITPVAAKVREERPKKPFVPKKKGLDVLFNYLDTKKNKTL
jgi:RNA recognition motif-containing protein